MQVISSLKKCQYTRERYQNLTEEEKNKKREYGHKHYKSWVSKKSITKSEKIPERSLNKFQFQL